MAELIRFGFIPGLSIIHRLDPRVKLFLIAGVSICSLISGPIGLILAAILVAAVFPMAGMQITAIIRAIRFLLLLLFLIPFFRGLSTPGESLFCYQSICISREGVIAGAILSSRLLIIVVLGLVLTATTRTSQIRWAVEWFLRPIPFLPHQKIGTMIGLLVRFIPVVLNHAREISAAQICRGIENRKNPFYRTVSLCMPLFRKIIVTADRLAMAMEARCYGDLKTCRVCRISTKDLIVLGLVLLICLMMLIV
ncbi:MAG: energy-coupling factor transporter transmembrane protein EcfT [Desulfobacteraceae bacterium]|nr:energy-coupling factor transporter transmembrane protein EcfT [Desulfobacteraceae bacterium]